MSAGLRKLLAVAVVSGPLVMLLFAIEDPIARELMANSAVLAAGTLMLSVPVGTALAVVCLRTDVAARGVAIVLLGMLLVVPPYLQASAWLSWFTLPGWSALDPTSGDWFGGMPAAIWVHAVAAVPWVALIVGLGVGFVEPELEEESMLVAGAVPVFLRVTLRRAAGSIVVAGLWVTVLVTTDISVTDLFQVRTYAEEIYTRQVLGTEPGAAPLAAAPLVVGLAWLAVVAATVGLQLAPVGTTLSARRPWQFRLGRFRWPVSAAVSVVVGLMALVPVASLMHRTGVQVSRVGNDYQRSWSVGKLLRMVAESPFRFGEEFVWSGVIALLVATAAVAVAAVLAWVARRGAVGTVVTVGLIGAAAAIPGPLVGTALVALLSQGDSAVLEFVYNRTIVAPWAAQLVRAIGPTTLVCWHAFHSVAGETLDAAATEGADAVTRWWWIGLGQRRRALAAAWLVAWIVAFGELSATILTVPPGVTPITVRVFGLLHYGVDDQVAAVCLVQLLVFACLAGGLFVIVRRRSADA